MDQSCLPLPLPVKAELEQSATLINRQDQLLARACQIQQVAWSFPILNPCHLPGRLAPRGTRVFSRWCHLSICRISFLWESSLVSLLTYLSRPFCFWNLKEILLAKKLIWVYNEKQNDEKDELPLCYVMQGIRYPQRRQLLFREKKKPTSDEIGPTLSLTSAIELSWKDEAVLDGKLACECLVYGKHPMHTKPLQGEFCYCSCAEKN